MSSKKVVDEILRDLNRIPKNIETVIDIKKIANQVSQVLQRQMSGRISQ